MSVIPATERQKRFLDEIAKCKGAVSARLWQTFAEITTIPRPSDSEGPMVDYLNRIADASKFVVDRDKREVEGGKKIDNILIHIPATPGFENAPKILLQGHSDMVPQKEADSSYDPKKDGVYASVNDIGEITAEKTTLGADNGIGIAMALALVANPDVQHGEIGILVTSCEENGMAGANNLNFPLINDFDYNINLDWEREGEAVIGSAAGGYTHVTMPIEKIPLGNKKIFSLDVAGLNGGHSGLDIDQRGGNSAQILAEILSEVSSEIDINLVSMNVGSSDVLNAIPFESKATIAVDEDKFKQLHELIRKAYEKIGKKLNSPEKENFTAKQIFEKGGSDMMLSANSSKEVLKLVSDLPHGVKDQQGENVITSTNLANVEIIDNELRINMMSRSSFMSDLEAQKADIAEVARKYSGVSVVQDPSFPGWEPNENVRIVEVAKRIYHKITNKDLKIRKTHAGLECGVIGIKYPNLAKSTISLGPTIDNAHQTTEKTYVDSVERTYAFLNALVSALSSKEELA